MDEKECARRTRMVVVHRGGRFMASPQIATAERSLRIPPRSLYFRGRSAVLGDAPVGVVGDLFGMFPDWLVELALGATADVPVDRAVDEFAGACWAWARTHLAHLGRAESLAEALFAVADDADAGGLALFSGWRAAKRPEDAPARLGHALMVVRELRGGLHFAALRARGLGIVDAVLADPEVGPERLRQTGWRPADVGAALARRDGASRERAQQRWSEAQDLTDEAFGDALSALGAAERADLAAGLADCEAAA